VDSRPPLLEIGITLAGVALLVGLVFAIPELHEAALAAVHGETDKVRSEIASLGVAGPLLILTLTLLHAVVFYPAEIVDAAAGLAYGFLPALLLMMTGWLLSALACFFVGRSVARPLLDRWFGAERFARFERMVERGGVTLLIALRLLPIVPFSLISAAAGAARVPFGRYCWTTAVGFLPITALAVYLGTRLEGIRFTDPAVIGAVVGVFVLLFGAHFIIKRSGATEEGAGEGGAISETSAASPGASEEAP